MDGPEINGPEKNGAGMNNVKRPHVRQFGQNLTAQGRHSLLLGILLFLAVGMGCSSADLVRRPVAMTTPTRTAMPTFTNTPDVIAPLEVVTPTPGPQLGVIIVQPGQDPRDLVPTVTPRPTATVTPSRTSYQAPILLMNRNAIR